MAYQCAALRLADAREATGFARALSRWKSQTIMSSIVTMSIVPLLLSTASASSICHCVLAGWVLRHRLAAIARLWVGTRPSLREVDTITNGTFGVEAKSAAPFMALEHYRFASTLPSKLEREQMECKHVKDGVTIPRRRVVPDVLLIDPCKECNEDMTAGGFHCVVSSYLGLTIINGYEEDALLSRS